MSEILRLIAAGLLALCACYIGVLIKQHFGEREKYFTAVCDFVNTLSAELAFKKTSLPQIALIFLEGRKGGFEKTLSEFMQARRRGDSEEKLFKELEIKHLKTAEKKEIIGFLNELGKSSLDEQLASVARAGRHFEEIRHKCTEENKRQGGMYFKLCVLLGLALLVILA